MKKVFIFILICSTASLCSQEVVINKIREQRNIDPFGQIELTLNVKNESDENLSFKIDTILIAIDNTKKNLYKPISKYDKKYNTSNKLKLLTSSIKATHISKLKGIVSINKPTIKNGGIIKIDKYVNHFNKNLIPNSKAKLILIDGRKLDSLKKADPVNFNNKIQKIKQENSLDTFVGEISNSFKNLFSNIFNNSSTLKDPRYLNFFFFDPNNEISNIIIKDNSGKKISGGNMYKNKNIISIYIGNNSKENNGLEIILSNPNNIQKLPFYFNNILLP
ncbi:hypothetical protein [Polaribacter sp.]|uniref:hypothetical protein n=1 Tax=Polaribacter sp. TaxID=1920175 RepID=UPI003EF70774